MADITVALTLDGGPASAATDKLMLSSVAAGKAVDQLTGSQKELVAQGLKAAEIANTIDIQNKKAVETYLREVAAIRATAQELGVYNQVQAITAQGVSDVGSHIAQVNARLAEMRSQLRDAATAQEVASAAAGTHGLQLGLLRRELGTMVAQATGTNGALDRMGGAIGAMGLGNPIMIGAMAGIAAIGFAWEHLADKTREANKENEEVIKQFREIAAMDFTHQAQKAATIYSGTGNEGDLPHVRYGLQYARQEAAQDQARINAGTTHHIDSATLHSYETLSDDAKEAAKDLALVNKWLLENEKIYQSTYGVNGRGGSMQNAATRLVASDQPGFTTDALHQTDKDAQSAQKLADAVDKASLALSKYLRERSLTVNGEMGQLERDRDAAVALLAAEQQGTQATREQQIANEVNRELTASHITMLDEEYGKAKALIQQTVEAKFAAKDKADSNRLFHEQQVRADNEDAKAMDRAIANTQKYQEDIQHVGDAISRDLLHGIEQFATRGTQSFESFFGNVDRLAVQMVGKTTDELRKLQQDFSQAMDQASQDGDFRNARSISRLMDRLESLKSVAGGVAVAMTAALSGYNLGSSSGSSTVGALGGAAAGGASGAEFGPLGIAGGALLGAAAGLFGASEKQEAAAEAMRKAAMQAYDEFKVRRDEYVAGPQDSVSRAVADENATYKKVYNDSASSGEYFGEEQQGALNAAHTRNMQRIADDFFGGIQADLNALNGPAGEYANALAQIEKQYEANKQGAIALSASSEQLQLIEDLRAKSEQKLADTEAKRQRDMYDDADLRYKAATGDPGYEKAKRDIQERNEIEAAVKNGADAATLAMIRQAQAAEDLANATDKAAQQQRGLEDLTVRDMRATGNGAGADDLWFQLQQKREYDDAVKAGRDKDYLDQLRRVQQHEADSRAAQQLIDSTKSPSGGGGGSGSNYATSATSNAYASITQTTGLELVDQQRAANSFLRAIEVNTRGGGSGGGGGAPTIVVNNVFRISGELSSNERHDIVEAFMGEIEERLGLAVDHAARHAGYVGSRR